jgi:NADH-quinone oxidoreductase subunit J
MPIGQTLPFTSIRWDDILFVILAVTLIGSALLVVTLRDIIRCGLAMIVAFAALAGIYVLLGNPLIAATQVLVYIGAISVLVLFAIMLTQRKNAPSQLVFQTQTWAAAVAAVVIAVVIAGTVLLTTWPGAGAITWTNTTAIATMLFSQYVLPFEVVSVLLTAAVVGGVLLARREPAGEEDRS